MRQPASASHGVRKREKRVVKNQKLGIFMLLAVAVWQVSLTGSQEMTIACGFGKPSPCKKADNARKLLYGMAGASALGLVLQPLFKKEEKPQPTQKRRPPIRYGGKQ